MKQLDQIKEKLAFLMPEMTTKFHVQSIGIFGSAVRNDFNASSDLDLIVDFYRPVGIEFIDLAEYLEKHFHRKVDLVSKKGIKKRYLDSIAGEIIYI